MKSRSMIGVAMLAGLGLLSRAPPLRAPKAKEKRSPADVLSRQQKNAAKRARRAARYHKESNA